MRAFRRNWLYFAGSLLCALVSLHFLQRIYASHLRAVATQQSRHELADALRTLNGTIGHGVDGREFRAAALTLTQCYQRNQDRIHMNAAFHKRFTELQAQMHSLEILWPRAAVRDDLDLHDPNDVQLLRILLGGYVPPDSKIGAETIRAVGMANVKAGAWTMTMLLGSA